MPEPSIRSSLLTCLIVLSLGCSTANQAGGANDAAGGGSGAPSSGGSSGTTEAGGGQIGGASVGGELQAGGLGNMPSGGVSAGGDAAGSAGVNAGGAAGNSAGGVAGSAGMPAGGAGGASAIYGGASRCQGSTFQLCEDFERGTLDSAIWTVQGKAPTIDGDHVARGSKAMHVKVPSGQYTRVLEKKTFREPDNTYYGRVFVYFKALPYPNGDFKYSHWTLLAASGDGLGAGGDIRLGGQLQDGVNRWGVGTDNRTASGTGDWTNIDQDPAPDGKPAHIPTDTWMCIEWMHAGPSQNETKFWWDGVEHRSIDTTLTQHGTKLARGAPTAGMGNFVLPNFTALWLGWQAYQGGGETFELWLDEIAIDRTRIGCDK